MLFNPYVDNTSSGTESCRRRIFPRSSSVYARASPVIFPVATPVENNAFRVILIIV